MPNQANKALYDKAVEWIKKNPQDNRISEEIKQDFLGFSKLLLEKKNQLISTLVKTPDLPLDIKKALPWLTGSLDELPDDMIKMIGSYLSESDVKNLILSSRRMHTLFSKERLLDKFLQCVGYGEQNKAEKLFTHLYEGNEQKIQQALLYRGKCTDYSSRTFHCSAYEYAYWAKDTHMCRMLERYMDDATKAEMLARVTGIEHTGLPYTQLGVAYCTHHFDFTPLIRALQFYVYNYNAWHDARNWAAMNAAWMNVGLAQRDVPAHVAQEYCRLDRSFEPRLEFNEAKLPRVYTFFNWITSRYESWFPLGASNSGLGFDFALIRGNHWGCWRAVAAAAPRLVAAVDLAAITRLDEVRTVDLTQSREHLNPPAVAQSMRV